MKYNRYKVETKYALIIGLLSSLEEEVVSDDEYITTKDADINKDDGFKLYFEVIIKPWFLLYNKNKREKIIILIEEILNEDNTVLDYIFKNTFFVCYIKNHNNFLIKLKKLLEPIS